MPSEAKFLQDTGNLLRINRAELQTVLDCTERFWKSFNAINWAQSMKLINLNLLEQRLNALTIQNHIREHAFLMQTV